MSDDEPAGDSAFATKLRELADKVREVREADESELTPLDDLADCGAYAPPSCFGESYADHRQTVMYADTFVFTVDGTERSVPVWYCPNCRRSVSRRCEVALDD